MAAGRGLVDDDDRPGAAPVAVLSYRAWRDQYGLDPAVVGGTFLVSGVPVTVVGIAAEAFFGETLRANPPNLFLPLGIEPTLRGIGQGVASASGASTSLLARPDQNWLYIVGRLRAGASPQMVQEKVSAQLRDWLSAQSFLSDNDRKQLPEQHIVVTPAATGVSTLRTRYAEALRVLGGRLGARPAHCLRESREPAARARAAVSVRDAGSARREPAAAHPRDADERAGARDRRRRGGDCSSRISARA